MQHCMWEYSIWCGPNVSALRMYELQRRRLSNISGILPNDFLYIEFELVEVMPNIGNWIVHLLRILHFSIILSVIVGV